MAALDGGGIFYVVIGGIASAILGRPRWTWDIDLLVDACGRARRARSARWGWFHH